MTQAISKSEVMTLEEFLDWYPEDGGRYELYKGVIFEMQPTGTQEEIVIFLALEFGIETKRLQLTYLASTECLIKSINFR